MPATAAPTVGATQVSALAQAPDTAPVELELKLAVAPTEAEVLARHPLLLGASSGPMRTERMLARYIDTQDGLLSKSRMALRLRREGRQWIQTFKTSSGPALALSARGEWEQPVAAPQLDWAALGETPLAQLPDFAALRDRLKTVFAVRFRRRSWLLTLPDGTTATASLDDGEIACGRGPSRRAEPISEFELEFGAGDPAELWKFAARLSADLNLVPLSASKGARGSRLAGAERPQPLKTRMPPLDPAMDVHAALALALAAPLSALQHNLRHLDFADPEFVHHARVAMRRMRSVLRAFGKVVESRKLRHDMKRLEGPLKDLGRTLGAARDADVFGIEALPRIEDELRLALTQATGVGQRLNTIATDAAARREAAHAQVAQWLATPQYGRLLLAAERLIFDASYTPVTTETTLEARLGPLLARQHDKVQRAAEGLTRRTAEERHDLRIEVKRLRYLLDIALPLWPGAAVKDYRKTLETLQEMLGTLNDLAEAGRQLADLGAAPVLCDVWAEHERQALDRELPRVVRELAALDLASAPWRSWRPA